MQDFEFDELDLRILHALQVRPRAAWTALAPVVGADPVTVARRWENLREQGLCWVAAYRGATTERVGAFLEIECAPSSVRSVAQQLAEDPEVLTIDLTAGGRDMLVTLFCRDDADLARYLLDRIPTVEGIQRLRTHRSIQLVVDAQVWRLRSLTTTEVRALEHAVPVARAAVRQVPPEIEHGMLALLREDGRASVASMSAALGISIPRTRSALTTLVAQQRVILRLEVARPYSGWPVYAWYFLQTPASRVSEVAGNLRGLEEVRLITTTAGQYSLVMAVWLRRMEDITRLERHIAERLPFAEIADRSVVLRTPRHLGINLEPSGRRTMPSS
ncbi:Lrp/AsnC family transcriptional regulator [Psychromicrobium xiongbiense]|uniref:Lrp/AsnC family transcriptional regulator n=1 Tax=Psychromicrobium xiongbiense TaxID=3051184 RepID=UPI00255572A8|nr:Lrp/AsnC family transcriptional regulator [Psychromicrobium sp. YIM S02556]